MSYLSVERFEMEEAALKSPPIQTPVQESAKPPSDPVQNLQKAANKPIPPSGEVPVVVTAPAVTPEDRKKVLKTVFILGLALIGVMMVKDYQIYGENAFLRFIAEHKQTICLVLSVIMLAVVATYYRKSKQLKSWIEIVNVKQILQNFQSFLF